MRYESARKAAAVLLVAVLSPGTSTSFAAGTELEAHEDAMNELSIEMIYCVNYYSIAEHCFGSKATPEIKQNFEQYREGLLKGAIRLARSIRLKPETTTARIEMTSKELGGSMGGDCRNIAILLNRFNDSCHRLANDPGPRFNEIRATKRKEAGLSGPPPQ